MDAECWDPKDFLPPMMCAGGCGRVIDGPSLHERFEGTDMEGTPILLCLCERCATKHDLELDRG